MAKIITVTVNMPHLYNPILIQKMTASTSDPEGSDKYEYG